MPTWRWATVELQAEWVGFEQVAPMLVRLDGDSAPLPVEPETLIPVGRLTAGTRVLCLLVDRRVFIVGAPHGGAGLFRNAFDEMYGVQSPDSIGYNSQHGPGSALRLNADGVPEWLQPTSTYAEGYWSTGTTDGLGSSAQSRRGSVQVTGNMVVVSLDFQRATVAPPNEVLSLPLTVPQPVRRADTGITAYNSTDGGCQVFIDPAAPGGLGEPLVQTYCRAGVRYIGQLTYFTS